MVPQKESGLTSQSIKKKEEKKKAKVFLKSIVTRSKRKGGKKQ